jgi:hypothetical protein
VFGPSLPGREGLVRWANQLPNGGPLVFRIPLFGGASDTAGQSKVDNAHTVVHRDGTKVCESNTVSCEIRANQPPGRYRVEGQAARNPGAKAAQIASLTVVSYDDGAHWQKAPVVAGKVLLQHPAKGYVSLRAKASDTAGNNVEQTIIRAYRLR